MYQSIEVIAIIIVYNNSHQEQVVSLPKLPFTSQRQSDLNNCQQKSLDNTCASFRLHTSANRDTQINTFENVFDAYVKGIFGEHMSCSIIKIRFLIIVSFTEVWVISLEATILFL